MIVNGVNNAFVESQSPHSMGLQNALTIPNPGFDQNPLMANDKLWAGQNDGFSRGGLRGLTFDGTGLLGTGLFASMDPTTWGAEWFVVLFGVWMLFSTFHTTKQAVSYAKDIPKQRRKKKAEYYRKLAHDTESGSGWF
jgi:hypothetical protein